MSYYQTWFDFFFFYLKLLGDTDIKYDLGTHLCIKQLSACFYEFARTTNETALEDKRTPMHNALIVLASRLFSRP